jgi:SAM-dependent methyltransferase
MNLKILDVGCGKKPFYPFLKPYASEYIGTDIFEDNLVDVVCPVENLKISDEWADVVLCLSVMEHVDDPILSIQELYRVLKPGGILFLSTHGCFPWHPYPQDHWRWTQTGLPLFIYKYGKFSNVEITSCRGSISGIFFLLAHYMYAWASKGKIRIKFRKTITKLINKIGDYFDKKTPSLHDINRHVTAIPDFFCIVKK